MCDDCIYYDNDYYSIYVLKLRNNKYYVGQTQNLNKRIQQHFNGNGSQWTQLHKPVKVIKTFSTCSHFVSKDERMETLKFMNWQGINNVRGSGFCKRYFNNYDWQLAHSKLHQHLGYNYCNNCVVCAACGRDSHTYDDCYARWDIYGDEVDHDVCSICGRDNHYASNCYARKTVWGNFV